MKGGEEVFAYLNLKEVMERESITQVDIAEILGVHRNTVEGKINGSIKSGFDVDEAFKIKNTCFKKYDLTWLFARHAKISA